MFLDAGEGEKSYSGLQGTYVRRIVNVVPLI